MNNAKVRQLVEDIAFPIALGHQRVVIFTSGNAWYIDTLVANLLRSAAIYEPSRKIGVFCTDDAGAAKCASLGVLYARVHVPALGTDDLTERTDASTEGYTRLSFVKVVLCRFILDLGMIPLYLDPDMAFKRNSTIDNLLGNLYDGYEFICAGEPKYMNSNILLARPSDITRSLFSLSVSDVERVIRTPDEHGDEDFFRPKLDGVCFCCVARAEYPAGCDKHYFKGARMIHANCVSGLENKIQLLREAGAWYDAAPYVFPELKDSSVLSPEFTVGALVHYPYFLEGKLFEEYFAQYVSLRFPRLARRYINATWTNLYSNAQFKHAPYDSAKLQRELDALPRDGAYFTVVQWDRGVEYHALPPDTLVFGCCTGYTPIPLTYESDKLNSVAHKTWAEKTTLCSFIGSMTHPVRAKLVAHVETLPRADYFTCIAGDQYDLFLEKSVHSKFALAPRGFGRASFRFFEILKLGTVPVYIWDDDKWLPFADIVDYYKLCVVLHESEIDKLDTVLRAIGEEEYKAMFRYYEKVKWLFTYEGMCQEIVKRVNMSI